MINSEEFAKHPQVDVISNANISFFINISYLLLPIFAQCPTSASQSASHTSIQSALKCGQHQIGTIISVVTVVDDGG